MQKSATRVNRHHNPHEHHNDLVAWLSLVETSAMYEQNYAATATSTEQNYAATTASTEQNCAATISTKQNYAATRGPDLEPSVTEGWLWRRVKVSFEKGWYRLENGELACLGPATNIKCHQGGESLGKVSGAVITCDERYEFTLCAPLVTLEAARLALPHALPSRPPAARQTRSTRRAPSAFAPRTGRISLAGWRHVRHGFD